MAFHPTIRLDVYSHNVKVTRYGQQGKDALLSFCRSLAQYELKKTGRKSFTKVMTCIYAAATGDRKEFRFHRHQLNELKEHLLNHGYREDQLEVVHHGMYEPVNVSMTMDKDFVPRDYQVKPIEYIAENDHRTKILVVQTGRGKTKMLLAALTEIRQRVALIIKGMYVEKWVGDVRESLGLKPGEVMVVRGSSDLVSIINLALAGELNAKFIIITNKTMFNYLRYYESNCGEGEKYSCHPHEFFETLGVGVRAIDEVHQDFHLNFRLDLYTHVPKTVSLTATLEHDDPFMNRMYEVMFPRNVRFAGIAFDRYIAVRAIFFSAERPDRLRYKGRRGTYSHITFENYILKTKKMKEKYFSMVYGLVNSAYMKKAEKGQKLAIFCASVEMCTNLCEWLIDKTGGKYDIRRYTSEDDYSNVMEPDIIVTTIKSAGTALDIPDLRTCLLTEAIGSRQANEQVVGRLRRLKRWPDVTPEFLYLVCENIPQHIKYHEKKLEVLRNKVLSIKEFNIGVRI